MNVPLHKCLVITFLLFGLFFSVNGFVSLSNLRDAVLTAETLVGDVLKNVLQKFRFYNDFFDAAVEEHCVFKCPNDVEPKPNKNHKPTANGCGALGMKINSEYLPVNAMTKCCDQHDICYDICGNDKETCDVEFRKCLYKYCESYEKYLGGGTMMKACKAASKVLFTGTLTLGCKAYLDAQSKACFCPSYGWKDKKNKYPGADHQEL